MVLIQMLVQATATTGNGNNGAVRRPYRKIIYKLHKLFKEYSNYPQFFILA